MTAGLSDFPGYPDWQGGTEKPKAEPTKRKPGTALSRSVGRLSFMANTFPFLPKNKFSFHFYFNGVTEFLYTVLLKEMITLVKKQKDAVTTGVALYFLPEAVKKMNNATIRHILGR